MESNFTHTGILKKYPQQVLSPHRNNSTAFIAASAIAIILSIASFFIMTLLP